MATSHKLPRSKVREVVGHSMEKLPLSLTYLARAPRIASENPPLLLLLHGVGSNEHDLFSLTPLLDERFLILSARAPNTLAPGSYAWFHVTFTPQGPVANAEEAEASRQALIAFIREAVAAYGADAHRVYLMGFSQGAIMSASVALSQPELIAGTVLMSGRILSELRPHIAPREALAKLRFLVVHGTFDTVLSIHHGRASRDLLSSLPVTLDYHEYEMAHEVSQQSFADVNAWLSRELDRTA
jgi:phospholipase/carboxylesterase